MKYLKLYLLALLGCVMFSACGGEDEPGGGNGTGTETSGKEYSVKYDLPAEGCEKTYVLDMLKSDIAGEVSVPDWFTVTVLPNTSGSPSIKVVVKPNPSTEERKYEVLLHTKNYDSLKITFVQAGKVELPSGIDDIHKNTSDNPAYSPVR